VHPIAAVLRLRLDACPIAAGGGKLAEMCV
jgi:hypothetical protein